MGVTFGQPLWLWALLLVPVCAGLYLLNSRRRRQLLRRVVAPRLREQLVANVSHLKRRLRFGLFLLALASLIIALAQPRRGFTIEEATRKGRDLIIAIDTSRSMLANDLQPNRLTRAKLAAQDLINQLEGDRVGLIAFAGTSFLQAPLTADYSAVLNALNELDTEIIPRGGTNLASAISTAIDAFGMGESSSRALIIFTDGEELDQNAMAAAGKVAGQIKIFTIGVGSEQGSVIPVTNERGGTDFVRDNRGEIVKSKLDEGLLSRLADASGGFYLRLQNGPADMTRIIDQGLSNLTEQNIDERTSRRPIERYQWPLALGMLLMICALFITDRKRLRRTALAALLLAVMPLSARALEAVDEYEAGNFEKSYQGFQRHMKLKPDSDRLEYGSGTAAYKLGRFDEALASFSKALASEDPALRARAEYNIGNTLFQRGRQREKSETKIKEWKDALAHYEETLKLQPENEDAIFNRDLVKKLLEEEQKEQEEQKQQQDKNDRQDQQDQQEQQEPQEQQDKMDQQEQAKNQPQNEEQESKSGNQKEGEESDQKDQEGQSSQDQEKQDQPSGDQQDDKKGEQRQSQPGEKAGEDKNKPDQSGNQQDDQPSRKPGEPSGESPPQPAPEQQDRDRRGELQAQPGEKEAGKESQAQALAAAEAAEQEGKMSERQAAALLRSLQGDEVSVPLNQPPVSGRVTKDW